MHQRQSRLPLLLLAVLLLLVQPAIGCFSQSHLYQRRESSTRQRTSHAFAFGEFQPKTSELAIQASGPEGSPVRHSRHLLKSNSDLLVFNGRRSRFMTRRCKEKLEQLALLVRNLWNGHVRIRVHHAWMPKQDAFWDTQVGHSGLESLHYSGRAVDMSLVTVQPGHLYRDVTLGRLAQLAYYQAYFDYCKVLRDTLHCSVKSDDPMDSDWLACFPANATVVKRRNLGNNNDNDNNNGSSAVVPIDSLEPGDEILTIDETTGGQKFTRVIGYHHRLARVNAAYLDLKLASGHRLEVSPNHLVFAAAADSSSIYATKPTYASRLSAGQQLMTLNLVGGQGSWTKILSISSERRRGRYAPITADGHLLVDGVWVSSYAHTRHQSASHALFAPLRWLDRLGCAAATSGDSAYDSNGMHWYSRWLHFAARLIAPSGALFPN